MTAAPTQRWTWTREAAPLLTLVVGGGALYLATLCRSVYWYDSAEYTTAAFTLGVPHPPGYPLYTLLAHVATRLPLPVATAVNALSALAAVTALALLYGVARRLGCCRGAALGAGALLATSPAFWFNATVAEVYAPGLCMSLAVLLVLLDAHARGRPRLAWVAAGVAGLGLGVHYSLATLGLGYAALSLRCAWCASSGAGVADDDASAASGVVSLLRHAAVSVGMALLGACVFAYVVIRAGSDAVPNYASPPTLARLLWLLAGGNYYRWFGGDASLSQHAGLWLGGLVEQLGPVGSALALWGGVSLWRSARWPALGLLLAIVGNSAFFLRYGVEDREVFVLPSVALLCVLAGVAVDAAVRGLTRITASRPLLCRALVWGALAVLPVWSGLRAARDFHDRDLSKFRAAFEYGERLCAQLPQRAVILNYTTPAEWKYDAVFGMYMQHVLGRRRDVVVVKNVGSRVIDRLLAEGRPVYLYASVPELERLYALRRTGDLLRLLGRR